MSKEKYRAIIYRCKYKRDYFTAHCLELDVIAQDKTIEGAVARLLEVIKTQFCICRETGAQFEFRVPEFFWRLYEQAKEEVRLSYIVYRIANIVS